MNCCCEPLSIVLAVNRESATKAPLANCGPAEQKSWNDMKPLTSTRRIGAACETAQNSAAVWQLFGLGRSIDRFDSDRQKLSSATQLVVPGVVGERHWLKTLIEPLITTSRGDAPSPATWV